MAAPLAPSQRATGMKPTWRLRQAAGAALLAVSGLSHSGAQAQATSFVLPTQGCPMAHCDARMSNTVGVVSPRQGREVSVDRSSAGAVGGLGCVSNGRYAVCTGSSDPSLKSNLSFYDADGNLLWDDGGLLDATAWYSAAIISDTHQVIAADQKRLLRADPLNGRIVWQSAKLDDGTPISPVLVGASAGIVLLATKSDAGVGSPELSTWDLETGALLSHAGLLDPATGVRYQTINTPAVRGNRAYVLAAAVGTPDDGRLYALDVCEADSCGGRGTFTVAWFFPFSGPSSASPLLIGSRIFFDGLRGRTTGLYFGVDDLGTSGAQAWKRSYGSRFGFNAAQDPRGGLWISPWQSGTLLRVSEADGSTLQTVDVSVASGLGSGYSPVTAVSVSRTSAGAVVLTNGIQTKSSTTATAPYVVALDVSSTDAGASLWKYKVSTNALRNAPTGQYPVVTNAAGARRVVFRGTASGTFFIGEP